MPQIYQNISYTCVFEIEKAFFRAIPAKNGVSPLLCQGFDELLQIGVGVKTKFFLQPVTRAFYT